MTYVINPKRWEGRHLPSIADVQSVMDSLRHKIACLQIDGRGAVVDTAVFGGPYLVPTMRQWSFFNVVDVVLLLTGNLSETEMALINGQLGHIQKEASKKGVTVIFQTTVDRAVCDMLTRRYTVDRSIVICGSMERVQRSADKVAPRAAFGLYLQSVAGILENAAGMWDNPDVGTAQLRVILNMPWDAARKAIACYPGANKTASGLLGKSASRLYAFARGPAGGVAMYESRVTSDPGMSTKAYAKFLREEVTPLAVRQVEGLLDAWQRVLDAVPQPA